MRVLQIGSDRSRRGILFPDSLAAQRQKAYAKAFGSLDIIGFSLTSDAAHEYQKEGLHVVPTNSSAKLLYALDAMRIAKYLPSPDVVSVQDPFEIGFIAWLVALRLRAPLHVQVHTDFLSPEYAKLSILNKMRIFLAGFVLHRAARIRVVSPRIKEGIEKRYAIRTPIAVLPIFVDVQKYENTQRADAHEETALLVVARDAPEKNISLAIDSFQKVAPENSRLLICSNTNTSTGKGRILYVQGDPTEFYKQADLVIVPSKYEGYGMVIIEALASGVPVLSTDVGIAREAGAIVTTEDHFADALTEWFKNGPRIGELKYHPYRDFEEYVSQYVGDIASCNTAQKSQ